MSKQATKALIDANITANGAQAITGPILNNVLNTMVDDYGTQDEVSQLAQKVDDITNGPGTPISVNTTSDGWKLMGNGLCSSDANAKMKKYLVTAGQTIYLKLSADNPGVYQFQSAASVPSSGTNANLVGTPVSVAINGYVVVPSGATYLIVSENNGNTYNEVKTAITYTFTEQDERITSLESEVTEETTFFTAVDLSNLQEYTGIITQSGKWQQSGGACVFYPISPGVTYKITAKELYRADIAVLAESGIGSYGADVVFANGFNGRILITAGDTFSFVAPDDALSLYIRVLDSSGINQTPTVFAPSGTLMQAVEILTQKVAEVAEVAVDASRSLSGYVLTGAGDTWVKTGNLVLRPGVKYTVILSDKNVSMQGVTSVYARFAVDAYDSGNTRIERLAVVNVGSPLDDNYLVTIPDGCAYVVIGCRCAVGVDFGFALSVGGSRDVIQDAELRVRTFNSSYNEVDTEPIREKVGGIINGKDNIETFLFFTDPHLTPNSRYETMTELIRDKYISTLQKYYNSLPMDTCICGGDWLNFNHSNEEAAGWLGYCDGYMRKLFRNYLPVFGNHDNNPYNPNTSSSNWLKALTYVDIRNLMFRENKMTYYSNEAVNTRFYVLNSGISFIKGMTDSTYSRLVSNRWPQVDWLGQKLLSEDPTHAVIVMHIYSNASNESDWFSNATGYWAKGIHAFGANVKAMAVAYNKRQSITLNGNTYDFSNCEGQIAFIMCGHTHFDYVDTTGEIPIVCCTNLEGGYLDGGSIKYTLTPTFDNCVVDYDNGVLYAVRVGAAKSRIVHFVPQTLSASSTVELTTELTGTVTWESRDTSKATVSNGTVTGVASGIVGVKASDETTEEYWIIKVS